MNCSIEFQKKNYSTKLLNQATGNDAGSWWWWTNIIGSLSVGLIGLIGNLICFFVLRRFAVRQHSFVEYLRALSIFDFISLLLECYQSFDDLFLYLFSKNLFNLKSAIFCKFHDYVRHTMILLACWTIVGLTFDRLILVCDPLSSRYPNLSRRICNSQSARKIIFLLIILSSLINIPHSITQEWICRLSGHENSAAFNHQNLILNTNSNLIRFQNRSSNGFFCKCRISPNIHRDTIRWIIKWKTYVFHLFFYTLLPAIILIASNTAILKRLHAPRQIVGQQNEHLRSKLTRTLTLVSIIFLVLYFPHAIVQTLSILVLPDYQIQCDIKSLIRIRILQLLCELLNQIALGINFFLYILGVNHYRSATIQMLGLHHFQCFIPYLTVEHRNSLASITNPIHSQQGQRRNTQVESTNLKLLKIIDQHQSIQ